MQTNVRKGATQCPIILFIYKGATQWPYHAEQHFCSKLYMCAPTFF